MLEEKDFMLANSKDYMENLPRAKREELISFVRESRPRDCLECYFFKWLDDGRQSCALGYDDEIDMRMKDKLCPIGGER